MERAGATTMRGNPLTLIGPELKTGDSAPDFTVVDGSFKDVTLKDTGNHVRIISVVPSLDTPVCDASVRQFNEMVAALPNTVMIGISNDLPFAQKRFCGAANIKNVSMLSAFRSPQFAKDYGVEIPDGALKGLTARAIVVLDENNRVIYSQRSSEIAAEPDYKKVLEVLGNSPKS